VGAVAEAVDEGRSQKDPHDAGHTEEGERNELGGVLLLSLVGQKLESAFLQNKKREKVRT
jgi:hypothetical protein